jgi:glyoxylase I family protein
MGLTNFAHVGVTCQDPVVIERFYTRYFGFRRARVIPVSDTEQIVFIKSGEVYLELFPAKEKSTLPLPKNDGPQYPGLRHLAFQVDSVDAKLAEIGNNAKVTLGPLDFNDVIPGWRTAWIADPEGNIVEITQGYRDEKNHPPLH